MSDILRYEILYQYGGLYVDIDFECLKNFDPLLKGLNFFAGLSNTGVFEINNALIAACPGHSILAEAVEIQKVKAPKGKFSAIGANSFPVSFKQRTRYDQHLYSRMQSSWDFGHVR